MAPSVSFAVILSLASPSWPKVKRMFGFSEIEMPALHSQQERRIRGDFEHFDEAGRRERARLRIHLQTRIVGMADFEDRLVEAGLPGRILDRLEITFSERGEGLIEILRGWRRAAPEPITNFDTMTRRPSVVSTRARTRLNASTRMRVASVRSPMSGPFR